MKSIKLENLTLKDCRDICDTIEDCDDRNCPLRSICGTDVQDWSKTKTFKLHLNSEDLKLSEEIETQLCEVDVKSTTYRIAEIAMSKNNEILKAKYGFNFYQYIKIKKILKNKGEKKCQSQEK